jgi:hypothetical protein
MGDRGDPGRGNRARASVRPDDDRHDDHEDDRDRRPENKAEEWGGPPDHEPGIEVRSTPALFPVDRPAEVLLLAAHRICFGTVRAFGIRTGLGPATGGRPPCRAISGAATPSRTRHRGQLANCPLLASLNDVPQRSQLSTFPSSSRRPDHRPTRASAPGEDLLKNPLFGRGRHCRSLRFRLARRAADGRAGTRGRGRARTVSSGSRSR